jgi:hypothetical protein
MIVDPLRLPFVIKIDRADNNAVMSGVLTMQPDEVSPVQGQNCPIL